MKIVPDANIYVSALVSKFGNPRRIFDLWLAKRFDILISEPILNEIDRVLRYPRITKRHLLDDAAITLFTELLAEQAVWVEPVEMLNVIIDDESDNRYVECAVAGRADFIVSGDEDLLKIGSFRGIFVLSPASFLALLNASAQS